MHKNTFIKQIEHIYAEINNYDDKGILRRKKKRLVNATLVYKTLNGYDTLQSKMQSPELWSLQISIPFRE